MKEKVNNWLNEEEPETLEQRVARLEEENKKLKEELNKPERMTDDENRAYWGTFG